MINTLLSEPLTECEILKRVSEPNPSEIVFGVRAIFQNDLFKPEGIMNIRGLIEMCSLEGRLTFGNSGIEGTYKPFNNLQARKIYATDQLSQSGDNKYASENSNTLKKLRTNMRISYNTKT